MTEKLKTWPERIWLQHGEEGRLPTYLECCETDAEITWCRDHVEPHDVEYVRADLANKRAESEPSKAGMVKCSQCDGKGSWYGQVCDLCGGSGKTFAPPSAQTGAQEREANWIAEQVRNDLTLVGHSLERSHLDGDAWCGTVDEIVALISRVRAALAAPARLSDEQIDSFVHAMFDIWESDVSKVEARDKTRALLSATQGKESE